MSDNQESIFELLESLKMDSPDAAVRFWDEFYARLVRYADRKLGGLPRRSSDEEDVALSAMLSFHEGLLEGRFPDLESKDDLLRILFVITDRKAKKEIRRQRSQKRGGGDVRGESVFLAWDEKGGLAEVAGGDRSASLAERLSIECEELLAKLDDDLQRKIALMKLQGYSHREIADSFGVATRTIERKLNLIRDHWHDSTVVRDEREPPSS